MHVSYLIEKIDRRKGTSLMLVNVKGSVEDRTRAFEWSEELMGTVYDGEVHLVSLIGLLMTSRLWYPAVSPPQSPRQPTWRSGTPPFHILFAPAHISLTRKKRLPCFPTSSNLYFVPRGVTSISPVGRTSFALSFTCPHLFFVDTTHHGHAHDIAKDLATNYDAVVAVSGDGLVHEVLNGFAEHADPIKAFSIPVAPIPTGSGNGLSLNLLGEKVSRYEYYQKKLSHASQDGFDVTKAALNVVKGA